MTVGIIVLVVGLAIVGSGKAKAQITETGRQRTVVVEHDALVELELGDAVVSQTSAIIEFFDDQLACLGPLDIYADLCLLSATNCYLARGAVIDIGKPFCTTLCRGAGFIDAGSHVEHSLAVGLGLCRELAVGSHVAQLDVKARLFVAVYARQADAELSQRHVVLRMVEDVAATGSQYG